MSEAGSKADKKKPLWKRSGFWAASAIAAISAFFLNVNTILREVRALPGEWGETVEQFSAWYYSYDEWKGHWTSNPEGWVDMAEYNLSEEPFHLDLDVAEDGTLAGYIENQGICDKVILFEFLLVEGEFTGPNSAKLEAWDLVGGYRRVFAVIQVSRDGHIIKVEPMDDPAGLFTESTRIGRDPDEFLGEEVPRGSVCPGKRQNEIMQMIERR